MKDPVKNGIEVFNEVLNGLDGNICNQSAAQLLTSLVSETDGLVIVDFLDLSNWDMIERVEFENSDNVLTLTWHSFPEENPPYAFQFVMKLRHIQIRRFTRFPALFFKGYALNKKDIERLCGKKKNVKTHSETFFSKSVTCEKNNDIRIHHTPLYAAVLLPKNCMIGTGQSRKLLYFVNYEECEQRLRSQFQKLTRLSDPSEDDICSIANAIRRILENTLKIDCAVNEVVPKKQYDNLQLGLLIGELKSSKTKTEKDLLKIVVVILNELSHDSGYPVHLDRALLCARLCICYVSFQLHRLKEI